MGAFELLIIILGSGAVSSTLGAFAYITLSKKKTLDLPSFETHEVKTQHGGPYGPAVVVTKPPLPAVTIASGGGRIDGPPHWIASATMPRAARRGHFLVERTSLFSGSPVGAVRVSPEFDARYAVASDSDDADVVRGWFSHASVVAALDAVFADKACIDVRLDRNGVFTARFGLMTGLKRGALDEGLKRATSLLLACAQLVERLDTLTDAAPVSSALASLVSGGAESSSSGAPVGIPVGGRRS